MINDCVQLSSQLKKHKKLFLRFTVENQKAQKYLLGGIEKTIEAHKTALLPKVAGIFKTLYDEDIVDEEVILDWGKKVSKKYVSKDLSEQIHKKAEPFLKWLRGGEEDMVLAWDNVSPKCQCRAPKQGSIQE